MYKVGLGQDSHPFEKNKIKPLILGGVKISIEGGLEGNSDGDVILHCICNALSSAIGGDSLGTWADEMCLKKGIKDSSQYLKWILGKVEKKSFIIENISISIEAKKPRLSLEMINQIKHNLASLLTIKIDQIGITITSGEGLTAFGRGEAIQALTIILLKKND